MRARLLRGIGSNLYAQAVSVAVQLGTLPVLVHIWGGQRFGLWLTLSAATAFLSVADGGVTVASGTAMTLAVARGDGRTAGAILARARRLLRLIAVLVGVPLAASLVAFGAPGPAGAGDPVGVVAALLVAAVFVGLQTGLVEVAFRANGDYPLGLAGTSTIRLCEGFAVLGAAGLGGGLGGAAFALLAVRSLGSLLLAAVLHRRAPWIAPVGDLRLRAMRPLLGPALAAVAVPAGLALSLQGATVAAGLVVPAGAVAVFVASRTLTRVIVQALGLVNHALMPEVTVAAGRGDERAGLALLRLNLLCGMAALVPGWVVLLAFGPRLLEWWTGGALRADPGVFALLATAALCHGAWLSGSNLLLATNRQDRYAFRFVAVAAVTCLLAVPLGAVAGLHGVATASLLCDLVMAALIVPRQVGAALWPARLQAAGAGR